MPNQRDYNSNNRSNWNTRRDEDSSSRRESSQRRDWYDRDPMDERSGYRDSEDRSYSSQRDFSGGRRNSSSNQGFEDFRHPYDYRSESSDRYSYGSDRGMNRDSNQGRSYGSDNLDRYDRSSNSNLDYGRNSMSSRSESGYGRGQTQRTTQGMWQPSDSRDSDFRGSSEYRGSDYQGSSEFREGLDREYSGNRDSAYNYGQDWGSRMGSSSSTNGSRYGMNSTSSVGQHTGRGPKGFKRSDERIKEEVCEMLSRDGSIDADDIDVEVKEGEVTLTGTVPEKRMKRLAEDCIEHCFGVKDVTNNIRVKASDLSTSSSLSSSTSSSTTGMSGKKSASSDKSTTNPSH